MRLLDQVVIVTGGGSGIGRAYAERLVLEGAKVVVADRDGPAVEEFARVVNESTEDERAMAVPADVTDESEVQNLVSCARERFGRIDGLVNNVGLYPHTAFEDVSPDEWDRIMRVNIRSTFLCSQAAVPAMREAGRGKIVNIATNLIWIGLPGMVPYVTAKAAILGFTRSLAKEIGPHGITVNAIAPGAVIGEPDALEGQSADTLHRIVGFQAIRRPQSQRDLLGTLVFLLSEDSDFMTDQVLTVDGGLTVH